MHVRQLLDPVLRSRIYTYVMFKLELKCLFREVKNLFNNNFRSMCLSQFGFFSIISKVSKHSQLLVQVFKLLDQRDLRRESKFQITFSN